MESSVFKSVEALIGLASDSKFRNYFGIVPLNLKKAISIIDAESHASLISSADKLISLHINGQYAKAYQLAVSLLKSRQTESFGLQAWLAYFCYWNARRSGENSEVLSELKLKAETWQRTHNCQSLNLEWAVEWARVEMHLGKYPNAVQLIENFLSQSMSQNYSLYTIYRMYLCLGTCHQAMGQYSKSWNAILIQAKVVSILPAQLLKIQMLRRKASHLVESEKFESAENFLLSHEKYFQSDVAPLQRVQFYQEKLRLALLRGRYQAVESLLADITAMVHKHKLPLSILNMDVERCEVEMLVDANLGALQTRFKNRLIENKSNQNDATTAVIHFLLARITLRLGKYAVALNHMFLSLDFCAKWKYGRFGVLCLLLNSVIYFKQKKQFEAISYCLKGLKDAARKKLFLLECCSNIQLACLQGEFFPFEKICKSVVHSKEFLFRDIFHAVNQLNIQWPAMPHLEWQSHSEHIAFKQSDGIELFFAKLDEFISMGAVFFEQTHQKLFWFENSKSIEILLSVSDTEILKLFFQRGARGVIHADIHDICYGKLKYQPDKHRARCAMTVSRLAENLLPCGLVIGFNRSVNAFVFNQNSIFLSVHSSLSNEMKIDSSTRLNVAVTQRQRDLLKCIENEISVSSLRLRTKLFITRQSLHQLMAPLLKKGMIVKTGVGKATRYKLA